MSDELSRRDERNAAFRLAHILFEERANEIIDNFLEDREIGKAGTKLIARLGRAFSGIERKFLEGEYDGLLQAWKAKRSSKDLAPKA